MIAKITSGSFVKGLILYNDEKVKSKEASVIAINNIVSSNKRDVIKTFQTYNKLNTRISKPNFHVSLNFVPGENISNEKMKEIAEKYMEDMGYSEQPFIVYRHYDRDHSHMHIISTRVQENGKAISTSHNFRKSVSVSEQIEVDYDLLKAKEQSKSADDLSYKTLSLINEFIEKKEGNQKQLLENVLRLAYKNPNITSKKDFDKQLEFYNVSMREYDINAKKGYSLFIYDQHFDEKGIVKNSIMKPLKASSLHHSPTEDNLRCLFEFNKKFKRKHKTDFKTTAKSLYSKSKTNKEFKQLLYKSDIKYQEFYNKEGKLYGNRFFDSKTGLEYKGSEIDLSANTISRRFGTRSSENTKVEQIISTEENIFQTIMNDFLEHSGGVEEELSLRKKRKRKL